MEIQKWSNPRKLWLITAFLLGVTIILVACSSQEETPIPTPVVDCPTVAAPTPVSFEEVWKSSPHADGTAAAFTHWDASDPQEIPVACARCHSRVGFLDFLGVE